MVLWNAYCPFSLHLQAGGGNEPDDDESDKSKSEVNDEEDESGEVLI